MQIFSACHRVVEEAENVAETQREKLNSEGKQMYERISPLT